MNVDVTFCRRMLSDMQAEPAFRKSGKRLFKDAWVWSGDRRHWEFHGPDNFYWHGRADNAYDARYKGWFSYLERSEEEEK